MNGAGNTSIGIAGWRELLRRGDGVGLFYVPADSASTAFLRGAAFFFAAFFGAAAAFGAAFFFGGGLCLRRFAELLLRRPGGGAFGEEE